MQRVMHGSHVTLFLALSFSLFVSACSDSGSGAFDAGADSDIVIIGGDGGGQVCAAQSKPAGNIPLDLVLLVDTSYSMDFSSKWTSVKPAIESFAADQRFYGLGLGMQYFPDRLQCSVGTYAVPRVAIDTIPAVTNSVVTSLGEQRMAGGTPMAPALQGVLAYAKDWATKNPLHKTVVVMATDGIPDDSCMTPGPNETANTLPNIVTLASDAYKATPGISTFVIGVGTELGSLNQIAQAGGTGQAILVDVSQNVESAFFAALTTIRAQALACDYEIPMPTAGTAIDYDRVNVQLTYSGGQELFPRVKDAASCGSAPGWYYDDPSKPARVKLCDKSCERVRSVTSGQVNVLFGCLAVIM